MSVALSTPSTNTIQESSGQSYPSNNIHPVLLERFSDLFSSDPTEPDPSTKSYHTVGRSHQVTTFSAHANPHLNQSNSPNTTIANRTTSLSFTTMSYPSAAAQFGACPFLVPEHTGGMKASTFQTDNRIGTDYMRVDFNPIVESLNFVPNSSAYEAIAANNFGTWSLNGLDTDPSLKPRVNFGVPCQPEDYCGHLAETTEHSYPPTSRRHSNAAHHPDLGRLDIVPHPRSSMPSTLSGFEEHIYTSSNGRPYNPKLFNLNSSTPMTVNTSMRSGLDLTRNTADANPNPLMRPRSVSLTTANSTQGLSLATNTSPLSNSVLMTPDSSTAGFMGHKFGTSSDDGELSPTLTNTSSQPRTAGRLRKAAPTLATGRRNLKNEPVDPDEADRRMKRRERNRRSAQKCRERKVQRTQELQAQVDTLQREINRLMQERDTLKSEARQFVNLLQLHCPGVAVPYMSCLNDNVESLDVRRESHGILMHSVTNMKSEQSMDDSSVDWRLKNKEKMENGNDCRVANVANDQYPSSMMPMQSQCHANRMKTSVYAFCVDNALINDGIETMSHPVSVGHVSRSDDHPKQDSTGGIVAVSGRGMVSASSSSPGSNYDMSFTTTDGPTSLSNHLELAMELCPTTPTSVIETTPMILSSPTCLSSALPSSVKPPNSLEEPAYQPCDEWEQLNGTKSDTSSPINSSISLNSFVSTVSRSEQQQQQHQQVRPTNACIS